MALLNRGTPSSLVTPDGTLHIALMRASSAWPAGVWIDGPRRTPADGSSFAWQHWSHEFRYALAAGAGDWRDAGFVVSGQEYNHDLLACETGIHDGPLPPSASLAEVSTPGRARPAALLSALKPRGNPLASGLPGRPGREAGVTIRLRDAGGLPAGRAPAQVSLRAGITAAEVTDLTERAGGPAVEVAEGRALVAVPPAGLVTVTAQPGPGGLAEPGGAGGTGPEPVQPVFTRYWLHGKGPAPAGNLPVTVHLSPDRVTLNAPDGAGAPDGADAPARLCLTVACGTGPMAGEVTLEVPPGLAVTGPDGTPAGPLEYSLTERGYARWDLPVAALPGARPGRYFVSARTADDLGQVLEDTALITVGEPPAPARGMPREQLDALLVADLVAREAEVEVAMEPAVLEVAPGECAALTVRLDNRTASVIRGESQLMSPFGTWHQAGPWTRGFTAAPGETITVGLHRGGARLGAARISLVGAGQGDVLRPGPLHRVRPDPGDRLTCPPRSVALHQMSAAGRQLIRIGPEIGDPGDQAVVAEFEEAQAGLGAFRAGEIHPAGGVLVLAHDPLHREVPVVGEALHVEPQVGLPATDLLPGLRAAVDHVVGEQGAERVPVPGLCRGPVGRDHLMRLGHTGHATRRVRHRRPVTAPRPEP